MLSFSLALDRSSLRPGERSRPHLVVAMQDDTTGDDASRAPLSLVFAIDTSSSMRGEPLHHVVESVDRIVNLLSPRDRVAIVAFAQDAHVLLPLRLASDETKRDLHA